MRFCLTSEITNLNLSLLVDTIDEAPELNLFYELSVDGSAFVDALMRNVTQHVNTSNHFEFDSSLAF
jgi:hypothetical protein